MKHFITIFLIFVGLFFRQVVIGQTSYCDKAKISKADKKLIEQFWTDFKKAVNTSDKIKLASLIKFPFNCDYCILDSAKNKSYDYLKVTKKLFDKKQFKIFFDPKLKKTINKYPTLFDILSITTDGTGRKCDLNFGYGSVEPSKTWEGQQHFFSIKKVNGKFLITSAWTVP
ncbi:MAG TPA: hypothetical protein VFT78_13385 [Hanamia sp.]|nr:hypothetical protein [Hanamia sp.]